MSEKTCTRCGQCVPLPGFVKDKRRRCGYAAWCKGCQNSYAREYAARPHAHAKKAERARIYRQTEAHRQSDSRYMGSEAGKQAMARYRSENRQKVAARRAVRRAIESGVLLPPAQCCRCGLAAKEYHHYAGYEQHCAMMVVPLCKQCHVAYEKIQKCAA